MLCICKRDCMTPIVFEGKPKSRLFKKDSIENFEECPPHWEPVEGSELDFGSASEAELLSREDWDEDDLIAFVEKEYEVKLRKGMRRETYVDKLTDARYRHVEKMTNAE
jgi:hypothetical protein